MPGMVAGGAMGMQQPGMMQQKPQTYSKNGHVMRWINTNPYPGATAVNCDHCG